MLVRDELCHDLLTEKMNPKFAFSETADYNEWRAQVRKKFIELNGLDGIEANEAESLNLQIQSVEEKDGYTQTHFTFESEKGTRVPCYLLVPKTGKKKYPVAICLQGHSNGYHISVAEFKDEYELVHYGDSHAFGVQAIEHGFAALCIEQRALGVRRPKAPGRIKGVCCEYSSLAALLLGRTTIGERVFDVHKAIDALEHFPVCDRDKIMLFGISGGGTATYYSACYDDRIKLAVPIAAVCTYEKSILYVFHCSCNYIPFVTKYCDMQDFSCLIAPKNLLVFAGEKDDIFLLEGAKKAYATIEKVYQKVGKAENCRFEIMPCGHNWVVEGWTAIMEEVRKLGW